MELNTSTFEINRKGEKEYNLKYKIIMLGNPGVGKSSICIKHTKNIFNTDYVTTLGTEIYDSDIKYNDLNIKFDIWDTAGQEKYNALITNYYKNSSLAILVYAIDE